MDFDKFLGEMQKLITASQQGDLFGNKDVFIDKSVRICEEFLKASGFSVRRPMNYPNKIKKPDDLIKLFYMLVEKNHEDYLSVSSNTSRDRAIAKAFVKHRIEDGNLDYNTALQQCGMIITQVFKRTDVFKFDTAPSFGIFGQGDMAWVTERAVQLINEDIKKEKEIFHKQTIDRMTEELEKESSGISLEELEKIRARMEK